MNEQKKRTNEAHLRTVAVGRTRHTRIGTLEPKIQGDLRYTHMYRRRTKRTHTHKKKVIYADLEGVVAFRYRA